jgi:hypothetical protein
VLDYCARVGDLGQLIACRYQLIAVIGNGGMGAVWRSRDTMLERDVAIKQIIFPPGILPEEQRELCARLIREGRAAARLSHPAVVVVHDVVEHAGLPWIVMELFGGGSLEDLLVSAGPLPYRRVAEIGLQVVDALAAAHTAGVVHRDVKPSNVLVNGSRVKLTDFGAATLRDHPALTMTGQVIGTPAFMAPEHARGKPVPESDLWSLGATLYTAAEGRLPFPGDDNVAILSAVLTGPPDPPRLAGPLEPILMGLLRAEPAERFTAERTAFMLGEVAAAGWAATPAPSQGYAPVWPRTPPPRLGASPPQTGPVPGTPQRPETLPGTPVTADMLSSGRVGQSGTRTEPEPRSGPQRTGHVAKPIRKTSPGWRVIAACLAGIVAVVIVIVAVTRPGVQSYAPTRSIAYPSGVGIANGVVSLSANAKTLAVGARGNAVYLWDAANGRYLGSIRVPGGAGPGTMAFSPDGTLLAAIMSNGSGYVWDVGTGSEISSLNGDRGATITGVAFSPEGTVVAYSDSAGFVHLWDVKSRRQIGSFGGSIGTSATSLAFSPDGKELAISYYDSSVQLWHVSDGRLLFTLNDQAASQSSLCGDGITDIAFSPNGKTLAAGDCNGSTYLWNPVTGQQSATLTDPGSTRTVTGIAFSGSGTLATADYDQSATYLWNISTQQVIATLSAPVIGVAASPRESVLATIGNAGNAYLWSVSQAR